MIVFLADDAVSFEAEAVSVKAKRSPQVIHADGDNSNPCLHSHVLSDGSSCLTCATITFPHAPRCSNGRIRYPRADQAPTPPEPQRSDRVPHAPTRRHRPRSTSQRL